MQLNDPGVDDVQLEPPNINAKKSCLTTDDIDATRTGWPPCLHDLCKECHGTRRKADGSPCIHLAGCNCPKCNLQA